MASRSGPPSTYLNVVTVWLLVIGVYKPNHNWGAPHCGTWYYIPPRQASIVDACAKRSISRTNQNKSEEKIESPGVDIHMGLTLATVLAQNTTYKSKTKFMA